MKSLRKTLWTLLIAAMLVWAQYPWKLLYAQMTEDDSLFQTNSGTGASTGSTTDTDINPNDLEQLDNSEMFQGTTASESIRSDLRSRSCFFDVSCIGERKTLQTRIDTLRSSSRQAWESFRNFFYVDLDNTEKDIINGELRSFITDLDTMDSSYRNALIRQTTSSEARSQARTIYSNYVDSLSSYVDPSQFSEFQKALQTIILNRLNIRRSEEARRTIRPEDETLVLQKIESIGLERRADFLSQVLSRIEAKRNEILSSTSTEARKQRLIGFLQEVEDIIREKIDQITIEEDFFKMGTGTGTGNLVISVPTIMGTSGNSVTVSISGTTSGTLYYVVLPNSDTAPNATQILSGQTANGQAANLKWSVVLNSGNNSFSIGGLLPNTNYTVYFSTSDNQNNLGSIVQRLDISTGSAGSTQAYPMISAFSFGGYSGTGAYFSFTSNNSGSGYYVILPTNSSVPSASQIRSGRDANWQAFATWGSGAISLGSNQFFVSGINPNTSYSIYFIGDDRNGNLQSNVQNFTFSTPENSTGGANISIIGTTATGTIFSILSNTSGTGYYIVLPSGSTAPSAAQIKLWQASDGASALITGVGMISSWWATQFSISGLVPNTDYNFYFVSENSNGNMQWNVQIYPFRTRQY